MKKNLISPTCVDYFWVLFPANLYVYAPTRHSLDYCSYILKLDSPIAPTPSFLFKSVLAIMVS